MCLLLGTAWLGTAVCAPGGPAVSDKDDSPTFVSCSSSPSRRSCDMSTPTSLDTWESARSRAVALTLEAFRRGAQEIWEPQEADRAFLVPVALAREWKIPSAEVLDLKRHAVCQNASRIWAQAEGKRTMAVSGKGKELMITPNILTGILIGSLWIAVFLVGFCCLFAVQTPAAFEELSDFPLAVILPRSPSPAERLANLTSFPAYVDQKKQQFVIEGYFRLDWTDNRLATTGELEDVLVAAGAMRMNPMTTSFAYVRLRDNSLAEWYGTGAMNIYEDGQFEMHSLAALFCPSLSYKYIWVYFNLNRRPNSFLMFVVGTAILFIDRKVAPARVTIAVIPVLIMLNLENSASCRGYIQAVHSLAVCFGHDTPAGERPELNYLTWLTSFLFVMKLQNDCGYGAIAEPEFHNTDPHFYRTRLHGRNNIQQPHFRKFLLDVKKYLPGKPLDLSGLLLGVLLVTIIWLAYRWE
ncbi:hypothetical protein AK812_SmicGene12568 [Symbiodinium microadriaticum]|uniref:V-type proton ATPase subunit S1/VOA1 transmembrane domain-containing protein n=1 Tax=Symbiodinium microadriaticum TaxID=2951 RepID=A0A1Q9EA71_SYMMI|nr:hypothetical protein AK812_SmicGene12568 [Symbiodinium microadriaticum]